MAKGKVRLTAIAHREVSAVIRGGDLAIDATAGNGHDTLFLARRVGATGRVYAFDIQAEALEQTRRRLADNGLAEVVTLIHLGHEHLCSAVPEPARGGIAAVMFNLGYRPGSDKQCITRKETTLAALQQATTCLQPGGVLTVITYPGHAGGGDETAAVRQWLRRHPALANRLQEIRPPATSAPTLFVSRLPETGV